MSDSPTRAATGRSEQKRDAIIEAARDIFLDKGYSGTSMDEIAARAGVSKQTIYKNFANKDRLFTEIITRDIAEAERGTQHMVDALPDTDDLEGDLRAFARLHVREVVQPDLVRMRRMVIAEGERFPDLARTWYDSAPDRAHATLADRFSKLADRGLLHMDDPHLAAQLFNWLVLSIPLNRAMFYGNDDGFGSEQLDRYADEAVRVFLAAYGAA